MKTTTTIHDKEQYVATIFEGRVTLRELGAHIQSLWADPAWKNDYDGVLDFSAATLDLSELEVEGLTKSMATNPRCSFGKWAFVVSRAADFAKLRKIDESADLRATLRIFFDRRTAEGWLLSRGGAGTPRPG